MANTIDKSANLTVQITQVPMTGSDVGFTFNSKLNKAQVQAGAATTSMYLVPLATGSSGHAPFVLPNGQTSLPLELMGEYFGGVSVTFNGTNSTNVSIIEYLTAST